MNNREIDKLIAEKVMKVPCFLSQFGHGEVLWAEFEGQDSVIFHPTNNMRDAWMVVEKLKEQKLFVLIDVNYENYDVNIYQLDANFPGITITVADSFADTAPLAICKAALEAVEVKL
jgi:hypothetical protein